MRTYIIGTDTDAGKTYYGKKLVEKGYSVIKPIETGKNTFLDLSKSDSGTYAFLQNKPLSEVNLYFFNEPLSPHFAAKVDMECIDIGKVKEFINNSQSGSYVELAGGLLVPLSESYTQLDLIKETGGTVALVVGNKLGAINHALLTIEILKQNNIQITEVFFNDFGKPTKITIENERIIRQLGGF